MKKSIKQLATIGLALTLAVSNFAVQPVHTQAATKKVTSIKLSASRKTLSAGKNITLKVKKVTPAKSSKAVAWKSSNKKIATVTSKGKVTAKKMGVAKITATSKTNKKVKATCTIAVTDKNTTHSGSYKNTVWNIDKNGLLTVKGTGNMYEKGYPQWKQYAEDIKTAKIEVTGATNLDYLFSNCNKLTSVDLSKLDTSKAKSMSSMFGNCEKLTKLNVSNFNTSKVTNMLSMFFNCKSLTQLDVSNFNTSKVTGRGMSYMFSGCNSLTKLDLSNFNTSKTTDMMGMFADCSSLTELNLSSFNTSNVTSVLYH